MTATFKAALLATAMTATALLTAAGIVTLATADAAFAKGGGNGNGGNGGGGNGGRGNGGQGAETRGGQKDANGGGRPDWAGSRGNGGKSGGRSESARGGSDPISNFIRGLTGEEKREARGQARTSAREVRRAPTEHAPQASIAPVKRPARNSEMHPSALGNMNGAMNANINAVLAHIRNGNTNGPVGGFAALAIADAAYADADADRVLKEETLARLLEENGYDSVKAYQEAVSGDNPAAAEIPALDAAIAELGDDVNIDGSLEEWRPDPDAVSLSADAAAAKLAAEENLLASWNKNGDPDPEVVTDAERTLLDDLRLRLDGHEDEIGQAIQEAEARAASDLPEDDEEADASCDGTEGCDAPEEPAQDMAAAD